MKQLGNLAIVCAKRPDLLLQIYGGKVSVFLGKGPERAALSAPWEDDARISAIIHELNFGEHGNSKGEKLA